MSKSSLLCESLLSTSLQEQYNNLLGLIGRPHVFNTELFQSITDRHNRQFIRHKEMAIINRQDLAVCEDNVIDKDQRQFVRKGQI